MIKRTTEEQEQFINAHRASDKPARTWCSQMGIAYSTFMGWQRESRRRAAERSELDIRTPLPESEPLRDMGKTQKQWAALRLDNSNDAQKNEQTPPSKIIISCSGFEITVGRDFDATILTGVLKAVKRACC